MLLPDMQRHNNFKLTVETTTRSKQCASETRSASSLMSLKEERYKKKLQRNQNESLSKESQSLQITGHHVNLKQLDLTEECLQDDRPNSQMQTHVNRVKTYSQSQPNSAFMRNDKKYLNMSCSSLKDARANRKDSKQRLEDSLKRVEQVERDWKMLKSTFKPQEPLQVLKEVNEEAKKQVQKIEKSRDKDNKKKGKLSTNE